MTLDLVLNLVAQAAGYASLVTFPALLVIRFVRDRLARSA